VNGSLSGNPSSAVQEHTTQNTPNAHKEATANVLETNGFHIFHSKTASNHN